MEIVVLGLFSVIACLHAGRLSGMCRTILRSKSGISSSAPVVSVVVVAHDEQENLKTLLFALAKQAHHAHELILVLDRCSDDSLQVATSFLIPNLNVIEIKQIPRDFHPKKYGLTKAVTAATGEWMLLTDADCIPNEEWISSMKKHMTSETDVVLGYSPYLPKPGLLSRLIQYETLQTGLNYLSSAARGITYMGVGRNLAYRKSVFLKVNGFDKIASYVGGDDDLLVQKMAKEHRVTINVETDSLVYSIPVSSWASYWHQKTRHLGIGWAYPTGIKWKELYRWGTHLGFWLLFPFSAVFFPVSTILIFATGHLIMAISVNIVADRLQKRFNPLLLPFVDALYVLLMPVISCRSVFVKKMKWK